MLPYAEIFAPDFQDFRFTFRHDSPGVDYRLCAEALTKVIRAVLPEAERSLANSVETGLQDMFSKLGAYSPGMCSPEVHLSLREYSDLLALPPPFKVKIITAFTPRNDFHFDYPSPPSPDQETRLVGQNTIITEGWFGDGSGKLLNIHTELLMAMYENLQHMAGYGGAARDRMVHMANDAFSQRTVAA